MITYYETLEINENADSSEIKKAFRKLAKQYHPDLNSAENAKEKFIEIEVAYSCLSDSKTRLAYDRLLKLQRMERSNPRVKQKYEQDVKRRKGKSNRRAQAHSKMSYEQFKRDELFRTSFLAIIFKSLFTILVGAFLMYLFYRFLNNLDENDFSKWWVSLSIYLISFGFVVGLIGLIYLYELIVKYIIVGRPKNNV